MAFEHKNLTYIGHMAIFYVPSKRLEESPDLERHIHTFLFQNYGAYTKSISPVQGFWRNTGSKQIFIDENIEYKVSYEGKERIPEFIDFLASLCTATGEQALYLEMGYQSYLVSPSEPSKPIKLRKPKKDADGHCDICGELWPNRKETLVRHKCPPGFLSSSSRERI